MRELSDLRAPSCFDFCADKGKDTTCESVKICDLDRNKLGVCIMAFYIHPNLFLVFNLFAFLSLLYWSFENVFSFYFILLYVQSSE